MRNALSMLAIKQEVLDTFSARLDKLRARNHWKCKFYIPGRQKSEKELKMWDNKVSSIEWLLEEERFEIRYLKRIKVEVEYEMAVEAGPWC